MADASDFSALLSELAAELGREQPTATAERPVQGPERLRSPVPDYLLQQQREGIPGANALGNGGQPDEALEIVKRASAANRLSAAGFDPNVTLGGSMESFARHDVPMAALGLVPGGRVVGKAAAAALPSLVSLYPSQASPADMPTDPASDKALNELRARQDAIRQQMDRQSEIMSSKTPRPRAKGQPEANEQSDPGFFTAKKAYDNLNQQFNALGGQIGEEQTARRDRARRQQEGDKRVQDARDNRGTADTILEDYAPTAAYAVGGVLGGWKGANTAGKFTTKAQTLADEAGSALRTSRSSWPDRAGGVNDFFSKGGAREVPFPAAPGEVPPFRINPNAPQVGDLYRQTPGREMLANAPWMAGYGADVAFGHVFGNFYRDQVTEAEKAMTADGSPANIARWEDAKRKEAMWETLGNAGRGAAIVHGATASIPGLVGDRARPPLGRADAERANVDDWIRRSRSEGGPAGPAPALPAQQPQLALPSPGQSTSPAAPAPQVPTAGQAAPQPQQPAVQPKRQPQSAEQSSPPPGVNLPKDHEWDGRMTGSKIRAPDGKLVTMPKDTTPRANGKAAPTDDAVDYFTKNPEGKLLRGSDAGDVMPSWRNKLGLG